MLIRADVLEAALQIPGWMSHRELTWLAERASQAYRIAEIGCWKGRSTVVLAGHTLGRVWAIDHWLGQLQNPAAGPSLEIAERGSEAILAEFRQHLAPYQDRCHILQMSSQEAAASFAPASLDFVFIDGAHEEAAVEADILAYQPLLRPGGLLAGHDYHSPEPRHAGVTRAVDRLVGPVQTCDYIWWKEPA